MAVWVSQWGIFESYVVLNFPFHGINTDFGRDVNVINKNINGQSENTLCYHYSSSKVVKEQLTWEVY